MQIEPLKRILLATDFSPASECARDQAALIASRTGAALEVLHVQLPIAFEYDPGELILDEDISETVRAAMRRKAKEFCRDIDGEVRIVSEQSLDAAAAIVRYAEQSKVDLLVLGSRRRRGLSRAFMGSVAAEVVRVAPVSTLVVGPKHEVRSPQLRSVVVALDFSKESAAALHQAADLAMLHDARFTAVHAIDLHAIPSYLRDPAEHLAEKRAHVALRELVDAQDLVVDPDLLVETGLPDTVIADAARSVDADLIVMGITGMSRVERFFIGSVTDRVLRIAPCPVLACRGNVARDL